MPQPLTIPIWPFGAPKAPGVGSRTLLKAAADYARTSQTIGIEWIYFAKAGFEQSAAAAEKLAKADSPAAALQIQADYARAASERLAAQAETFRDLYASLLDTMAGGARGAGVKAAGKAP